MQAGRRALTRAQRRAVLGFLLINWLMFLAELWGAYRSRSSGLVAESIHILSHLFMATLTLFALSRDAYWRNRAALWKGLIMVALSVSSLCGTLVSQIRIGLPEPAAMGMTGAFALACNLACLALLWPRRGDDLNMRSTWLCTATDLLTDAGLLMASALVWSTSSRLPDTLFGVACSGYAAGLSIGLVRKAWRALHRPLVDATSQFRLR